MKPVESDQFEVHDPEVLAKARAIMRATESPRAWAQAVVDAVKRNEEWRGERCINLLAPEAPTSPMVRALLSSEIGTRAAEGHIGRVNRWFAGTQYIDEVESLCVELLKVAFRCNYGSAWSRPQSQRACCLLFSQVLCLPRFRITRRNRRRTPAEWIQ